MTNLSGRRILIVEDEYMLATDLADEVQRRGGNVAGPVPSVGAGLALLRNDGVNGAILDVNLNGQMVFGLADELLGRGIPFVFATGYDNTVIPERFGNVRRRTKPCEPSEVVDLL